MRQTNITATVFGGAGDAQPSAYADVANGWPQRPGVALPFRFSGPRPKVRVYNGSRSVLCEIVDVGPWYPSSKGPADPYWQIHARPRAETDTHTNTAGIDLTPAAASAIGLDGKGVVDWEFDAATAATVRPSGAPATQDASWFGAISGILKAVLAALFGKPALRPPAAGGPPWIAKATGYLGFHETGDNQGIEHFIAGAHCGALGDPWCAIFANCCLEESGVGGTRSPSSQSFRHDGNFVQLSGPAIGAIAVYWRGSQASGLGHVGFYVGENSTQVLTLGGNESDAVRKQLEPKARLYGYWWPKSVPLPAIGASAIASGDHTAGSES